MQIKPNRAGIRKVALKSPQIQALVASTTDRIASAARPLVGKGARVETWVGGRARARGRVWRFQRRSAAREAEDGALGRAIRQAVRR